MEIKEKDLDKTENNLEEPKNMIIRDTNLHFSPIYNINKNHHEILSLFGVMVAGFLLLIFVAFCTFTVSNINNPNIIGGVYIKGIDVSNLSKEEAKEKLKNYINSNIPEEIKLKHGKYEINLSTSQLEIYFNTDDAIEKAYRIGRDKNVFLNNLTILNTFFTKVNVDPGFKMNEDQLKKNLEDISGKLPDKLIESDWYTENKKLIITKGSEGYVVNVDASAKYIKENINNLNMNSTLEIIADKKAPKEIDIEKIHEEIYKKPIDAYYTKKPLAVFPSKNGTDFACSLKEAKALLKKKAKEYVIPLRILYPNVTTNMIGKAAFPNQLSTFSTTYVNNYNRTTNLKLAAKKINGTVLMPGDTFSYNKVVGERTIAAGYKEAPIYVQGRVEDGLGGGICQIATTLYNAVLYANLKVVERSNHQFVPSYVGPSRDATVVYGAIDFKFKNNRDYPIKIMCSVSGGVANFRILGLKTKNDYKVKVTARTTGYTSGYTYSEAYKTLYKKGKVVSSTVISRDTYKNH